MEHYHIEDNTMEHYHIYHYGIPDFLRECVETPIVQRIH